MMKKWTYGFCAAALAMTLLAGCGNQETSYEAELVDAGTEQAAEIITAAPTAEETPTPTAETTPTETPAETVTPTAEVTIAPLEITPNPDPDEGLKLIGEKAEGTAIFRKKITNNTGKNITGVFVRDQWMEDWPDNMLARGDVWNDVESRYLYFDASGSMTRAANYEEKPVYRILLIFDDEDETILHDIPFEDMSDVQIMRDGSVFYLKYRSIADLSEQSTLEAEKDRDGGEVIIEETVTTVTEETAPADETTEEQEEEDGTAVEDSDDGDYVYVDEDGETLEVYDEDSDAVG